MKTDTKSPEYIKQAKKILRRKFFKDNPLPIDSELLQWIIAYQSETAPVFHLYDEGDHFVFAWTCGCGTDCDETGEMTLTEIFDKNGKLITPNGYAENPDNKLKIELLAARLKEIEDEYD